MVLAFQLSQLSHDLGSKSLLRSSRHLIECRFVLQDVYLAIPGSLGWILLPFDFCPGLAQHEITGRVGLSECLRFGTFPPKWRAQTHIDWAHSKRGENHIFLPAPNPLADPQMSDKNHIKCFLRNRLPGITPKLLISEAWGGAQKS